MQKPDPNLSLIVAVARNGAIGKGNDLLWHISEDLKRFKAITSGHTIVMGRKTYESFPKRPLPNRFHIVLSRTAHWEHPQVKTVRTVEEVLGALPARQESFVVGGGEVFGLLLPFCSKAYLTEVDADFEADTFFPRLDASQWEMTEQGSWQTDSETGLRYRYVTYKRI